MKRKIIYILIILQFFLISVYCNNEVDKQKIIEDKSQNYNPLHKAYRGIVNTTLCWVEIPRQAIKVNKEKKGVSDFFWAPLKGLTYTAGRFCIGVYEIITFLAPPYKPIVNPEFVFSEEKDGQ